MSKHVYGVDWAWLCARGVSYPEKRGVNRKPLPPKKGETGKEVEKRRKRKRRNVGF